MQISSDGAGRAWARAAGLALAVLAGLTLLGCNGAEPAKREAPPPSVPVSPPVSQEVTDYEDFTGRLAAPDDVAVKTYVTGYVRRIYFKEGVKVDVKAGDKLYLIDPDPYKVKVDAARADLESANAKKTLAEILYNRGLALQARGKGFIAQEDVDKLRGDLKLAQAGVLQTKAKLAEAELYLGYTTVRAEISGQISESKVKLGNLVTEKVTELTTIRSQDPLYAYFDLDEQTVLRLRRLVGEGRLKSAKDAPVPVTVGLTDEKGFPHEGVIDFAENTVDPGTGTLRVRAKIPNPKKILGPGMFVRVRVRIGVPHKALLVAEQALGQDQGQRFVYVAVPAKNDKGETVAKVKRRDVQVGPLHGSLRVVEKGVGPTDEVIVNGLQRVRPEIVVRPTPVTMPGLPGRRTAGKEVAEGGGAKQEKK
jgi:RND family efflux transporter MFP subunit